MIRAVQATTIMGGCIDQGCAFLEAPNGSDEPDGRSLPGLLCEGKQPGSYSNLKAKEELILSQSKLAQPMERKMRILVAGPSLTVLYADSPGE